ncbi:hypothetical protein LJC56_03510 [Christensenellaceae bacterium OttesenSCG-928-K19]|nr:hypothetical protein [Christensenellaceae bacterium OttesenSCG-928-K19]
MLEITNILKENFMPGSPKSEKASFEEAMEMQSFSMQMHNASRQKRADERELERMLTEAKLLPDGETKMKRLEELGDMVAGMRVGDTSQALDKIASELSLLFQKLEGLKEASQPEDLAAGKPVSLLHSIKK